MNEFDVDDELGPIADHLIHMGRSTPVDPYHKMRLRRQLFERHAELYAAGNRRWWHAFPFRRLAVAGPAALAATVVAGAVVVGLQITGNQQTPHADAQKLSAAMAKTAPTVTGWHLTVTTHHSNSVDTRAVEYRLTSNEHFYVLHWGGKLLPYLYVGKQPHGVPAETSGTLNWQYVFALLPARLASHQASVLRETRKVHAQTAIGVQYTLTQGSGLTVRAVAWVGQTNGRVLSLERQVLRGTRIVEEDWANYQYGTTS
jgi:hypothetical protein